MTIEEEQPAPTSKPGRRGKGYFLPGIIALAALIGIGMFVGAGDLEHSAAHTLDGTVIASQISLAIQAQQNSVAAPKVACPPEEPVRQGFEFVCTVLGHPPTTVQVRELDGRGRVEWHLPT